MTAPDQLAETLIKILACGSHPHTTLRARSVFSQQLDLFLFSAMCRASKVASLHANRKIYRPVDQLGVMSLKKAYAPSVAVTNLIRTLPNYQSEQA
jgi:hypothetical protein